MLSRAKNAARGQFLRHYSSATTGSTAPTTKHRLQRSGIFVPIHLEAPKDAVVASHKLLLQAGFVKKTTASGIYTYLPLGLRSLGKAMAVIDEEMQRVGGQKVAMPKLLGADLWRDTGRWGQMGPELIRVKDRKGDDFCLAPTHEEVVTNIVATELSSYKQLPLLIYQIGEKWRDELRPRYGLIRGREFVMKDAYSFDTTQENAHAMYDRVVEAYHRIMTRFELPYAVAEADSGNIGGNKSHEFHALAEIGEDTLLASETGGYTANLEKARGKIADFSSVKIPASATSLAVPETAQKFITFILDHADKVFEAKVIMVDDNKTLNVVLVPENREVNEYHVKSACGGSSVEVHRIHGKRAELESSAPQGLRFFIDDSLMQTGPWINTVVEMLKKDGAQVEIGEWRYSKKGDLSENGSPLVERKGIEIGHCFYLGTKYSKPLDCTVTIDGKTSPVEMGCYGIGVSRILAATIETSYDANGIKWPLALAPYKAVIIPMVTKTDTSLANTAQEIYDLLESKAPEVACGDIVIDDRIEATAGFKMKEAALIGYPYVIIIGKSYKNEGTIEVEERRTGKKSYLTPNQLVDFFNNMKT